MCCDNPPHERNWRLYYLLDLVAPTSSKRVKWTFRKVTLRHHYYQAYLVLYNKARKYLYDAAGEDAYGFIASGTWGPLVPMFGATGSILFYCILMMIEMAMLILFFAFLALRVDNKISWSWITVVAPLMVFVALMLLTTLFAMLVNFISPRTRREGMACVDRFSPMGNFLAACCYFCIPFVIGVAIRNDPKEKVGKFMTYMCIPIIGDILYYLTSLIWRWPRRLRLQMTVDNSEPSPVISWGIFFMAFLNMGCGVAQWVLIGKKIDGTMNRSWYIIFIPFCVRAGIRIAEACLRSMMKYTIGVRSSIGVAFDTLGAFFTNGILVVSLYFVAVRIERGREKVHMARALIPVYIVLAYIFVALIVTMIVLLVKNCESSRVERRNDGTWTPPPEKAEGAVGFSSSASSRNVPIPSVAKEGADEPGWEGLDSYTNTTSNAFPDDVDIDEEYDEFYTDQEEDIFPTEDETTHVSTHPSRPISRSTTQSNRRPNDDLPYEEVRKTTTITRREYHDPYESKTEARQVDPSPLNSGHTSDGSYTEETTYIEEETEETEEEVTASHSESVEDDEDYSDSGSYTEVSTYIDEETEEEHTMFSHSQSSSASFSSYDGSDDHIDYTRSY